MRIWRGSPYPLGVSWDGNGVNVAIYSEHASAVELCLFDAEGSREQRIRLPDRTNFVWHGYLPDLRPGQRYGFRAEGPHAPTPYPRLRPTSSATSRMRFENPHSLSYQERTLQKVPSSTRVSWLSKIEEYVVPLKSEDTRGWSQ